jgi:hypothetical protein
MVARKCNDDGADEGRKKKKRLRRLYNPPVLVYNRSHEKIGKETTEKEPKEEL